MKKLFVLVLWFIVCPAFSQDPIVKFCNSITPEGLRTIVEKLASPEFEGRKSFAKSEKKTADYLSDEFRALQLKEFSSNYQTDLSLPVDSILHLELSNEKGSLNDMVDFWVRYWFLWSNGQKIPVVYGGFGIDQPRYSDYSGIDVSGKFVAVSGGQPVNAQGVNLITGDTTKIDSLNLISYKTNVAVSHHAKGIMVIRKQKEFKENKRVIDAHREEMVTVPVNVIPTILELEGVKDSFTRSYFDEERFAELFLVDHHDFTDLVQSSIDQGKSPAGLFKSELTVNLESTRVTRRSQNVIGYLEGKSKEEVIVLGAHYDHFGKNDSTYFPGADDNASGVATVLEIAKAFARAQTEGFTPEKSILFACWGLEEVGFLGSQQYVLKSPYKPENTGIYINFDMVGRIDTLHSKTPDFVYALPINETGKQFVDKIVGIGKIYSPLLTFSFEYPDKKAQFEKRSDYLHFSKAGVPSLGFFTGEHPDYHTPKDTPDKLNYTNMTSIARLAFVLAWKEAGMEKR